MRRKRLLDFDSQQMEHVVCCRRRRTTPGLAAADLVPATAPGKRRAGPAASPLLSGVDGNGVVGDGGDAAGSGDVSEAHAPAASQSAPSAAQASSTVPEGADSEPAGGGTSISSAPKRPRSQASSSAEPSDHTERALDGRSGRSCSSAASSSTAVAPSAEQWAASAGLTPSPAPASSSSTSPPPSSEGRRAEVGARHGGASAGASSASGAAGVGEPLFSGFRRSEVVRLLLQSLRELGLGGGAVDGAGAGAGASTALAALEREAGFAGESAAASALRRAVLTGDWEEALSAADGLGVGETLGRTLRFLLLEQQCSELVSKDRVAATDLLVGELAALASAADVGAQERWEFLRSRILSTELGGGQESPERKAARESLWEQMASLLPPEHVVPLHRLSVLLWQAVRYQQLHCLYHDMSRFGACGAGELPYEPPPLLQDCACEPPPLPGRCIARLSGHSDEVWFIAVSGDGRHIASSSPDRSVVIWRCEAAGSFHVAHVLRGHAEPCTCVAWSPDGRSLLTASSDGTIRLWELAKLPAATDLPVPAAAAVFGAALATAAAARHFAEGGIDSALRGAPPSASPAAGAAAEDSAAGAAQGGGAPAAAARSGAEAEAEGAEVGARASGGLGGGGLRPADEGRGAVGGGGDSIAGASSSTRSFTKHTGAVAGVCWLGDSLRFVSAGFDKCILLWRAESDKELYRWEAPSHVQDLAVSHDGSRVLAVHSERCIKVIDVLARRDLPQLLESDPVTSICASSMRDEVLVNVAQQVSSSQHGPTVRLWDLGARRVRQRYVGHCQGRFVVRSCFGGPREEFVISGSEDSQVYIWHRHYGALLQVLPGHRATVNSVCWMQAKNWLVSAADDYSLRVWAPGQAGEAPELDVCFLQPLPVPEPLPRQHFAMQAPLHAGHPGSFRAGPGPLWHAPPAQVLPPPMLAEGLGREGEGLEEHDEDSDEDEAAAEEPAWAAEAPATFVVAEGEEEDEEGPPADEAEARRDIGSETEEDRAEVEEEEEEQQQ